MLVSEAFERYRQDRIIFAHRSPKTEESYRYTEKALLSFLRSDMPLKDLTFEQIRLWAASLRKKGLVSGTIRGYIVNTRAVLGYMQLLSVECINPDLIQIPERVDPTPTFLTPEEVSQFIKTAKVTPHCSQLIRYRNASIIALLYSSGIRVAELCSLNRDDVVESVFTVLGKGNKRRPCMIDARTRQLLTKYLQLRNDSQPALFIDNIHGTRLRAGTVQSQFRRLNKRSELAKQVHPHTLRHSFANNLMRNGAHIYPLSRIMGHSSIATTQVYFQMFDPELVEVYNKYHSV